MFKVNKIYACVISHCIVGNFVLRDPAISFSLDILYWSSRSSTSLCVHLSIRKQLFDRDAMLIGSECFSSCLRPGLFTA